MRSEPYSFVCLLALLHSFYCSLVVVEAAKEGYNAYDDATWAVVTSQLSDPQKQMEYNEFMDQCRKHAGDPSSAAHFCDDDEANRLQMNMYQPRSVRQSVFFKSRLKMLVLRSKSNLSLSMLIC